MKNVRLGFFSIGNCVAIPYTKKRPKKKGVRCTLGGKEEIRLKDSEFPLGAAKCVFPEWVGRHESV